MKYLDRVKVINMETKYENDGVKLGDIGTIWLPEIRHNQFFVMFDDAEDSDEYFEPRYCVINVKDLELYESYGLTEKDIAESLVNDQPWWCIVEDGFIKNLKGEKKNKIAYDYDS